MRFDGKEVPVALGLTLKKIRARPEDTFDNKPQNTGGLAIFDNAVNHTDVPPLRVILGRDFRRGRTFHYVIYYPEEDRVEHKNRPTVSRVTGPSLSCIEIMSMRRTVLEELNTFRDLHPDYSLTP